MRHIRSVPSRSRERAGHPPRHLAPVELGELGPLGDDDAGVGTVDGAQRRIRELEPRIREIAKEQLDKVESLTPVAVIAGHKRPGAPDTPNNIEETRKYIRDFDRIATNTKTASELYNQMLAIYPERVNPAVLWFSARAMKPGT